MEARHSRRKFIQGGLALGGAVAGSSLSTKIARAALREVPHHTETRLLLGTIVSITVAHEKADFAAEAMQKTFQEIERLQAIFDRHNPATPLSQLNRHGRLVEAPAELCDLVREALRFGRNVNSAFDITVGPLVDLWSSRANPTGSINVSEAELAETLELVDMDSVEVGAGSITLLKQGMSLTMDGIAKGAIADSAVSTLLHLGCLNHLVNAGGDIYASGLRGNGMPWNVAVEDPEKRGVYPAHCSLSNRALATSGSYEIYFDLDRRHHHLVQPENGQSPSFFRSVSVSGPSVKLTDALATTLSLSPLNVGLAIIDNLPECEALFIMADGSLHKSKGWG